MPDSRRYTSGQSPDDRRIDALVDVLDQLAIGAKVSHTRPALRRAVVSAETDLGASAHWIDVVIEAGRIVGLTVHPHRLSPEDVTSRAAHLRPLVAMSGDDDAPSPVAILSGSRRAAVVSPSNQERAQKVSADELASLLGIGKRDEATFVSADPASSLDVIGKAAGGPLGRLSALLRLESDDVWVTITYAVAVGLLSLATPLGVQTLVNTVALGALAQPLVVLTMMIFTGLAFAGVLRALQAYVVERVQQRLFVRTALDFAHRLPRIERSALEKVHGPELVNRFFDVLTIQKGAAVLLVDGIAIVLQTVVGMIILSLYHPLLLGFAVILAAAIGVVCVVLGRGAGDSAIKESKAKYALAGWLQDIIRHPAVFGSLDGAILAAGHAEDRTRDWLAARRKHFKVVFRQICGALLLQAIASAALLGIGGSLVIGRQLSLGQLVAAELIVTAVVYGFSKLGKYFESYYDLLSSVDKLGVIVDMPLDRPGAIGRREGPAALALAAVDVGDRLRDATLRIDAGERVGVLADDAAACDAFAQLLAGAAAADAGTFDVDRTDARALSTCALRTHFALVRSADVFDGTIAENVSLGRASRDAVRSALELVGAWDTIAALPQGVDEHVTTHAPTLTREDATRIAIARAVASHPRVLVLDRVLDGFRPAARDALLDALAGAHAPWTLVVTSVHEELVRRLPRHVHLSRGTFSTSSPL